MKSGKVSESSKVYLPDGRSSGPDESAGLVLHASSSARCYGETCVARLQHKQSGSRERKPRLGVALVAVDSW
jgi:hypothetical protein